MHLSRVLGDDGQVHRKANRVLNTATGSKVGGCLDRPENLQGINNSWNRSSGSVRWMCNASCGCGLPHIGTTHIWRNRNADVVHGSSDMAILYSVLHSSLHITAANLKSTLWIEWTTGVINGWFGYFPFAWELLPCALEVEHGGQWTQNRAWHRQDPNVHNRYVYCMTHPALHPSATTYKRFILHASFKKWAFTGLMEAGS